MTILSARSKAAAAAVLGVSIALAPAMAKATSCSTVAACVLGTNTGSGYGVEGTAKSNYAVFGTSSGNSGIYGATTVNATSASSGKSGISGYDSSTNKKSFNSGVFGFSAYGSGVHAKSTSGYGLYGESSTGAGVYGHGFIGVEASTPPDESSGDGYIGLLADSFAVEGTGILASGGEYGIVASVDETNNINPGAAVYATGLDAAPGILADTEVLDTPAGDADSLDIITSGYGAGLGVFGSTGTPLTLFATGKELMTASNAKKDVMSLDSSGNMILAGKLTQSGSPAIVSARADGTSVLAYSSRSADPTIEDVGEATVTSGAATVPLDTAFAGTIDFARPYFVFLTAEGDNAGLYVAAKTPRGFAIRETRGARSTLRVQYRIVASPLDARAATRLQSVTATLPDRNAGMAARFAALRERDNVARRRFAKLKTEHAAPFARG